MSRKARLVVRDTNAGTTTTIGAVFEGRFQGSYGVSLNLYDSETKERTDCSKMKFGDTVIDLGPGVFVNLEVYEPLDEKPPRD